MIIKIPHDFYLQDAKQVARELLGKIFIIKRRNQKPLVTRIVETESYMGIEDKAAHSFNGRRTSRTEIMYREGGLAYVYLIYGMYYCLNVVCNTENIPQAVLIRAVEPIKGLSVMKKNRCSRTNKPLKNENNLTNGPGKLCQSLGVTKEDNGKSFLKDELYFCNDPSYILTPENIVSTTRIGIDYAEEAKEFLYRFYIKDHPFVSHK